jgi:hypothetical protein
METPVTDPIVTDYLHRLYAAGAGLPEDRRTELVDEIADHIEQSRAAGSTSDEAGLRTLLDRLGDPQVIVAAAREDDNGQYQGPQFGPTQFGPGFMLRRPSTATEGWAFALMTVGSILPVLGWLIGAVLMWTSRRWRVGEKIIGTLIFPGGPFAVLWVSLLFLGGSTSCTTISSAGGTSHSTCTSSGYRLPTAIGLPLLLLGIIAPIIVCSWLYVIARRRAAEEPAIAGPFSASTNRWSTLEITAILLLTVGAFVLPVIGPIVGLIFVWASRNWTRGDKWVATVLAASGAITGLIFLGSTINF